MSKYKIPVIITVASHVIGEVECDSIEEYEEKANQLWGNIHYDHPMINRYNDFDWDIMNVTEDDLEYYEQIPKEIT